MTAATNAQPARPCAKMIAPIRKNGRGRGNPPISTRRNAAAPTLFEHVAFSFGGIRNHGIIAPSFFMGALHPQILTGGREGGSRACRFLVRGISTPHGLPSPWKGRAVLQFAQGASVMMRTLSRSVSTAFPSIPEPSFCPVESLHARPVDARKADTFTDIADGLERLLERCAERAAFIENAPADSRKKHAARALLRGYLSDLLELCADVQAIAETAGRPDHVYTVEARA